MGHVTVLVTDDDGVHWWMEAEGGIEVEPARVPADELVPSRFMVNSSFNGMMTDSWQVKIRPRVNDRLKPLIHVRRFEP